MIAQTFITTAEFSIKTGTQTNEVNAAIETQPVIAQAKISNCSTKLKTYMSFYIFHLLNHYLSFIQWDNFLFHLLFFSLNWKLDIFVPKILIY